MSITLAQAEKALQAAKAKAQQMNVKISIAVVDPRGDPVAALRMDGANYLTYDNARGKAFAAAIFGRPSGELTARADNPVFRSVLIREAGRIIPGQGAVPIKRGDQVIGAIGASGGTSQEDEDASAAGAAAAIQ